VTVASGLEDREAISDIERWRRNYRRSRGRRARAVAAASTVALAVVIWLALTHAPGWPRVEHFYFDWHQAKTSFVPILRGLSLNLRILAIAEPCVLVLGLVLATLRTLRGAVFFPIRLISALYVDVFRGAPTIVLLLLFGFGGPALRVQGLPTSATVWATIALVLNYTAYVGEVFRAGIDSVHSGQRAAARSLGLTYAQTLRLVVYPQAIRAVLPPLLNDFVSLMKDVGLVSVVGVTDAVLAAQIQETAAFNFTPYVVAALMFIALAAPAARIADAVSAR
jgi:polar amino acid transport system permease protein